MLDQIVNWITPAVEHFRVAGYWIAFIAAMAETVLGVGLLLPGSTIVLLLGAYAARGYLDFGDLIWFGSLDFVVARWAHSQKNRLVRSRTDTLGSVLSFHTLFWIEGIA